MYQIFSPPDYLKDTVRHYWLLNLNHRNDQLTEYMFAYPYVNWVFTLGTPYLIKQNSLGIEVKDTKIIGPRTNFAEYLHPSGNIAFGVTFKFGKSLSIIREETQNLKNKIISQDDLFPKNNWLTSYFKEQTVTDFMTKINGEIASQTLKKEISGEFIWEQFLHLLINKMNYSVSLRSISKDLKISQRHLQRITLKFAGITPKEVQSMIRCRLAIRHILKTGFTSDFFHYGYFDQTHFIKDVKKWTGLTPNHLVKLFN